MNFISHFSLYDQVLVDIETDNKSRFTITAVIFRSNREPLYEVSYFHNGDAKTACIEEPRLDKVEG